MGSPARKDDMSNKMETSSGKDDIKSSDSPRQNISFKFTKSSSKKLLGNKLDEDEIPAKNELVTSVEDKEIKSAVPKEEKKELVIPLIRKNTWRITGKSGDGHKGNMDDKERALHELALKEVLKESLVENDKWDKRESQTDITIPLVVQNKIPDGFETDMKMDVSLRPEESTLEDYEKVPVDAFGMAILRGMGWKPGEAIGGKNKECVKPVEVVVRPKGLGLGADKSASKKPATDQPSEEKLELLKKSYIRVTQGIHKGLYGQVEGLDDENARAIVKLATVDKCFTLPEFFLEVVSKKEFQKESRVLTPYECTGKQIYTQMKLENMGNYLQNRKLNWEKMSLLKKVLFNMMGEVIKSGRMNIAICLAIQTVNYKLKTQDKLAYDKYVEEKGRQKDYENGQSQDKDCEDIPSKKKDVDQSREMNSDSRETSHHKKKRKHSKERKSEKDEKKHSSNVYHEKSEMWVSSQLRVRLIDEQYKKGRYFNQKMIVEDILSSKYCVCKTDDGRFLDDIKPSMLETVIPRSDPAYVMIVLGKYKGQLGVILKKDKTNCAATVQLLSDREKVTKLGYDCICEYTGDVSHVD